VSGTPDHSRTTVRPFLIARQDDGGYRLTVRQTRFNAQHYPVVTATLIDETFASAAAARAYAKAELGAVAGEFAAKVKPGEI